MYTLYYKVDGKKYAKNFRKYVAYRSCVKEVQTLVDNGSCIRNQNTKIGKIPWELVEIRNNKCRIVHEGIINLEDFN